MNFGRLSAKKISEILAGGDNSPSKMISSILTKADIANERLNCFITICKKFALDSAARLEKKLQNKQAPGRLAGIPIAVKDNIITKDIPTTCGSRMLANFVPPYNATAISDLLAEDAGKSFHIDEGDGYTNISLRPQGQTDFGTKVELKNMNSFRYIERALAYESERQKVLLENGEAVIQETRQWDENENVSRAMRSKEETRDYRYFPEPDLPPLQISDDWIEQIRSTQLELPAGKLDRFVDHYDISTHDASILTSSRGLADYYEQVVAESQNPRRASGWILTEVLKALKDNRIEVDQLKIGAKQLGQLIKKIDDGTISGKIAKDIFAEMIISGREVGEIIVGKGLVQISDEDAIGRIIREVIEENEDNVRLYHQGKIRLWPFFVGQVMAKTGGRANPQIVNRLLKEILDGEKA
jgi:aspartyl/glutamyl-tRNA(Asn/Gln) amidotransferase B subunit